MLVIWHFVGPKFKCEQKKKIKSKPKTPNHNLVYHSRDICFNTFSLCFLFFCWIPFISKCSIWKIFSETIIFSCSFIHGKSIMGTLWHTDSSLDFLLAYFPSFGILDKHKFIMLTDTITGGNSVSLSLQKASCSQMWKSRGFHSVHLCWNG